MASSRTDPKLRFMLYPTVAKMSRLCGELGVSPPPFEDFDAERARGHVVILPPNVLRSAAVAAIERRRTAMISGWGADPNAKYRYQADAIFPLSDHADYDDLMRYVDQVATAGLCQLLFVSHTVGERPACINQVLQFSPHPDGSTVEVSRL